MDGINSCFINFQRSLQVLVPLFEKAGILWKNEEQYDDFDDIAQALFSSFVLKNVETYIPSAKAVNIKYDIGPFTGTDNEYFVVEVLGEVVGRFCKYITAEDPFDSVEVYSNASKQKVIISSKQADFELVCGNATA